MKIKPVYLLAAATFVSACSDSGTEPVKAEAPEPAAVVSSDTQTQTDLPPLLEGAKMAQCKIGPSRYEGPCVFRAESNGTFSVSMRDQSPIYDGVTVVTVAIVETGKAEVMGMTTAGNNSRWGSAVRSKEDPACWIGSDFEVCAY